MMSAALRLLAGLVLGAGLAMAALAQDPTPQAIDYEEWDRVALRAERAVEDAAASTATFEDLRSELASWRALLLQARDANQSRIETIRAQIEALGPAPSADSGETEPAAIAERRAALAEALTEAQAPGVNATEAYNRANGLIGEIDTLIRDRETAALLELGPIPLIPANWATALSSIDDTAGAIRREVAQVLASDAQRARIRDGAPLTVGLILLALVLLVRGRRWTTGLTRLARRRSARQGREALAFAVSLSQFLVPLAGVVALAAGVMSTNVPGLQGTVMVQNLIGILVAAFAALWLAGRLFPPDESIPSAFRLAPGPRHAARRTTVVIGVLVGIANFVEAVSVLPDMAPGARPVLLLPLYILLGLSYYRLARIFGSARAAVPEGDQPGFSQRFLGLLGRALSLVAIAGPVMTAAGYANAAEALMIPTALTLGLFGLLVALQVPIRDLYAMLTRSDADRAADALVPVLVNFLLVFAALPMLALIWGMRPAELSEVVSRLSEGVTLGGARITPGDIFAVILVFALGFAATRLLQGALKSTVLPRTRMDTGTQNAVTSGVGYVGIAIAALLAINAGGIDLTALGLVLGALSVGIGFGLQNVVSNFISGIILLIERPISEGDWIEVGGNMGIVKSISVRSTRIETFDRTDVIVPNADFISGTVTNWTRGNTVGRAVLTVGVAYGTDTRRVEEILLEIARSHPDVAAYPEPGVDFLGFGADSLDFRIRAILRDVNNLVSVKTEINHRIAERFAEEGIEIPFAQRDVWLRNPEALARGPGESPTGEDSA